MHHSQHQVIRNPAFFIAPSSMAGPARIARPGSLGEELAALGVAVNDPSAITEREYEIRVSTRLPHGAAHFSPLLKRLYFWNDLERRTMSVLEAVFLGNGLRFSPEQVVMDAHGYFKCAWKVALHDRYYPAVATALRLGGVTLTLRPAKPDAVRTGRSP